MTAAQSGIPTRDECLNAAGAALAAARATRDHLYAEGGPEAVARAAFVPGGPAVTELAGGYERLAQQARQRPRAALSTDEQICERGIEDSRARGKRPGPRVTRQVVAYASPFLTERDSEPGDAA